MIRIAIGLVSLALLASCATAPQVSPAARSEEKNDIRGAPVAPTWESTSKIEIGGSM